MTIWSVSVWIWKGVVIGSVLCGLYTWKKNSIFFPDFPRYRTTGWKAFVLHMAGIISVGALSPLIVPFLLITWYTGHTIIEWKKDAIITEDTQQSIKPTRNIHDQKV